MEKKYENLYNDHEKIKKEEEIKEQWKEIKPEDQEKWETMRSVANNMIASFDFNPDKESFLIITDDKVIKENGLLVKALDEELKELTGERKTKGNYKIIIAKSEPRSAAPFFETIGGEMRNRPILILTSMSRSHSPETGSAIRGDISPQEKYSDLLKKMQNNISGGIDVLTGIDIKKMTDESGNFKDEFYNALQKFAQKNRARIISCTKGTNPFEILTKGAAEESPEALKKKTEQVKELMKEVESVRITTSDGTDLHLNIRIDKSECENGDLSKPGSLSNYPVGEWACSPWWKDANGTLVVDGPFGGKSPEGRWHNLDWVEEVGPFELTINNGEITEINSRSVEDQRKHPDNKLIASFINYLDSGNNKENHGFKLAEFAVGINTKACKDKPSEYWGSTETEKKYGTCHIAVGSNGSFGIDKKDSNYNSASVHCDMVILDNSLNIECARKDKKKFSLIKNGEPQGY